MAVTNNDLITGYAILRMFHYLDFGPLLICVNRTHYSWNHFCCNFFPDSGNISGRLTGLAELWRWAVMCGHSGLMLWSSMTMYCDKTTHLFFIFSAILCALFSGEVRCSDTTMLSALTLESCYYFYVFRHCLQEKPIFCRWPVELGWTQPWRPCSTTAVQTTWSLYHIECLLHRHW